MGAPPTGDSTNATFATELVVDKGYMSHNHMVVGLFYAPMGHLVCENGSWPSTPVVWLYEQHRQHKSLVRRRGYRKLSASRELCKVFVLLATKHRPYRRP